MSELRLHSKLRQHRQIERSSDRFDGCRAVRQPDRTHPGTANGIDQRADLRGFGFFIERTEIERDGRSVEELGCGGKTRGELFLECLCVCREDTNLCQTHLTETNLERGLARGLGCVHRFDLTSRNDLATSTALRPRDCAKCSGSARDLQCVRTIIFGSNAS